MSQLIQPNNDDWNFLIRSNHILSYVDCLRRAGDNDHLNHTSSGPRPHEQNTRSYPYYNDQFATPLDFSLFTFGQPSLGEDHHLTYVLLSDLYDIVSIAASYQTSPLKHSTYDYLISKHEQLLPYISNQDLTKTDHFISNLGTTTLDAVAPLRLSTFILTSCLLSSHDEYLPQRPVKLVSQLRSLLSSRNHTNWTPFQGALVWCLAIGLRFADPRRDRTWFLMQFLRVTHLCVLETWDETSRSLELLVYGLERIGPVMVEAGDSTAWVEMVAKWPIFGPMRYLISHLGRVQAS